ncbi:MAG TPA: class II fructose-bisphosphatase [Candidatus Limnocylindria bacterium]|jgi:fructose-1,6-bisphosphatase II|nr:class II fructose-bisphosphatase [Candidatus Limnocylindria bacterium]
METHALEYAFVRATEAAAIAAGRLVGLGDKNAVDGAAVEAMRTALSLAELAGIVVIGEGEKDEAPMLYHGEEVGSGKGPSLDVAVDPIDGTTLASKGGPGAIAVIAAAPRGALFRTRVPYMEKLVTGPAGRGVISIERPLEENLRVLAMAKGREVSDLTVALLDRPRNESLMRSVRAAGARVRVFGDGDVANAVYAVLEDRARVDMLAGIGGSPEGVIAACAARALGGEMQGRLWARDERDEEIARNEGLTIGKTLNLSDLCASEDAIFAATGVTDGEFLDGVRYRRGSAYTQSIIISTYTHSVRTIDARHDLRPRNLQVEALAPHTESTARAH